MGLSSRQTDRGGHCRQPQDLLQVYYGGGATRSLSASGAAEPARSAWSSPPTGRSRTRARLNLRSPDGEDHPAAIPRRRSQPRWFVEVLERYDHRTYGCPTRTGAAARPPFFAAYGEWMATPPSDLGAIGWLRERGADRSCSKGVMRVDDAKAVDAGVSAISVSTMVATIWMGRQLDPGPTRGLGGDCGDQVEVLLERRHPAGAAMSSRAALGARAYVGRAVGLGRQRPSRGRRCTRHPARCRLGSDGSRACLCP